MTPSVTPKGTERRHREAIRPFFRLIRDGLELSRERFSGLSPITYALTVADRENLPWVVVQHGAKVRVYPARVGEGVGRRGRTAGVHLRD